MQFTQFVKQLDLDLLGSVKVVITGSLPKTWSRQNDVEVLRRLRQNRESWRHRNSPGARKAPSPLNGGRSTTLWLDKWDLVKEVCWQRHWLRQLPWGLGCDSQWLFLLFFSFWLVFGGFSCLLSSVNFSLAWTWVFLSHLRAWRDLSRDLQVFVQDVHGPSCHGSSCPTRCVPRISDGCHRILGLPKPWWWHGWLAHQCEGSSFWTSLHRPQWGWSHRRHCEWCGSIYHSGHGRRPATSNDSCGSPDHLLPIHHGDQGARHHQVNHGLGQVTQYDFKRN